MSVDVARQYIDQVELKLQELATAESFAAPPFKVGLTKFFENDAPPIIKWRFGSIEHEPSTVVTTIGTEVQELVIRIWGKGPDQDESEATTRFLKNRLMLACKLVAQASQIEDPIEFGDFDWNPEAHMRHGRRLEGSVFVKFGMPNRVLPTALMKATQITQHADYDGNGVNDETIHTTAEFKDDGDGNPEVVP